MIEMPIQAGYIITHWKNHGNRKFHLRFAGYQWFERRSRAGNRCVQTEAAGTVGHSGRKKAAATAFPRGGRGLRHLRRCS